MFIGNRHIKVYFDNLLKSENLSHAYLFHGPEGVGKRLFALGLAEEVSGNLPGRPDIKVIDKGGGQILISDIRELKDFIYLTPFGKHKVAVINNAHNLTSDASNALLKVLEEPPGRSVVFLISHLPGQIFETVVSRCQAWRFGPLKKEEICAYLVGRKIKKEVASAVSRIAGGSLGKAIGLADGFDDFRKNIAVLEKLTKADFVSRFETAKKLATDYEELKKTVGDWFVWSAGSDKRLAGMLLRLNKILSRPQFNHRLALEEFLVRL